MVQPPPLGDSLSVTTELPFPPQRRHTPAESEIQEGKVRDGSITNIVLPRGLFPQLEGRQATRTNRTRPLAPMPRIMSAKQVLSLPPSLETLPRGVRTNPSVCPPRLTIPSNPRKRSRSPSSPAPRPTLWLRSGTPGRKSPWRARESVAKLLRASSRHAAQYYFTFTGPYFRVGAHGAPTKRGLWMEKSPGDHTGGKPESSKTKKRHLS